MAEHTATIPPVSANPVPPVSNYSTDPDSGGLLQDYQPSASPSNASAPAEFDSSGLLGESVNDINTLTDMKNPLMKKADTAGKQYANDRGLLNSSMAAGAVQNARLDAVMPLVNTNAQTRGNFLLQNDQQDFAGGESALDRNLQTSERALDRQQQTDIQNDAQKQDILMENLSTDNKQILIGLEQQWNQAIQSDINLAAFWQTSIDGLLDIMNNPDITPDQQAIALDQYLGANGGPGIISSGLDFMSNLNGFSSPGGSETSSQIEGSLTGAGEPNSSNPAANNQSRSLGSNPSDVSNRASSVYSSPEATNVAWRKLIDSMTSTRTGGGDIDPRLLFAVSEANGGITGLDKQMIDRAGGNTGNWEFNDKAQLWKIPESVKQNVDRMDGLLENPPGNPNTDIPGTVGSSRQSNYSSFTDDDVLNQWSNMISNIGPSGQGPSDELIDEILKRYGPNAISGNDAFNLNILKSSTGVDYLERFNVEPEFSDVNRSFTQ